jgi:hypothetical protein
MKSFTRGVIAAIAIGGAALVAPGIASADSNFPFSGPQGDHSNSAYWTDITDVGVKGTVAEAGSLATLLCAKLGEGYSEGQLIATMADGVQSGVRTATFTVHAAEWHFCPAFY